MTYQYLKNLETKENRTDAIYRVEDRATIPFDPANTDYQAYLKWLAEGNQPLPASEGNSPA